LRVAAAKKRLVGLFWLRIELGWYFSPMTIQIHPEAAKRFNELADQLLTKIVPKPEPVPSGKAFRPDVRPVVHIAQQDIIGQIEVKDSVFDTARSEDFLKIKTGP
jgi:hypothetical protein